MTILSNIFGYIGGSLLVINQLPQLYLTLKTKKTDDLSFWFILLQVITCICFLTYGILLEEVPLIIANSIVLVQLLILLSFKKVFSNNN